MATTSLKAGDIAILGFNFDNPDEFGFVTLTDIVTGTEIKFTDNGWFSSGGFRSGEGTSTWIADRDYTAGSVINPNVGTMAFSASGDQILAYQGTESNPNFIYAINSEGNAWQSSATSSNTSGLPIGLIEGQTAVALTEIDNAVYSGITTGTKAELQTAIASSANWIGSNTVIQTIPTTNFTVTDAAGGGGNAPNPPNPGIITPIYEIQGTIDTSLLVGQSVTTTGIVTAVDSNGFYLQDASGDGNNATSDAIFVFTSSPPTVTIGDEIQVEGTVSEFTAGGASSGNLSTTQISNPTGISILSTGNILPTAAIIGSPEIIPPSSSILDGISFYESLEGMRVTVSQPIAVSTTNRFGEFYTLANNGLNATGVNQRGGITISANDFNPERIQIDPDSGIFNITPPDVNVGDRLSDVTGVVSYGFGSYEVIPTENFTVTPGNLAPETTNLVSSADRLTVASYNVENLDPNDTDGDRDIADGKFNAIATQIVNNLQSPDIIALQEVQDNSGSANDGIVDASVTYQTLIDSIIAAGGPTYSFADIAPVDGTSGGQPGGNIRVGYLYKRSRVTLVPNSLETIGLGNTNFDRSRLSLAAKFQFNGEEVTLINNHFSSKGGSDPLFGSIQPPANGNVTKREGQALEVNNFVDNILATDANANVVVLGDLNEYQFNSPVDILKGGNTPVLNNLTDTLAPSERYTYNFQGNSQALDHILVSNSINNLAEYDVVHINSEYANQATDHDPGIVRLNFATTATPVTEIQGDNTNNRIIGTANNELILGLAGNDTLKGKNGDDRIIGGSEKDLLEGGVGIDTLDGGSGNDRLIGGSGNDILTGGMGSDRFVFFSPNDGIDTITDFNGVTEGDKIRLSASGFGGLSVGRLDESLLHIGSSATTVNHRLIYDNNTGALYFDRDGIGGAIQEQFAMLENRPDVFPNHFSVIA